MDRLKIFPKEYLLFDRTDQKSIFLESKISGCVAFIIKTNLPDFFSVKPAVGILKEGEEIIVVVRKHGEFFGETKPAIMIEFYEYEWKSQLSKKEIREMLNIMKIKPIKKHMLTAIIKKIKRKNIIPYYDKICNAGLFFIVVYLFFKMTYI